MRETDKTSLKVPRKFQIEIKGRYSSLLVLLQWPIDPTIGTGPLYVLGKGVIPWLLGRKDYGRQREDFPTSKERMDPITHDVQ